MHTLLGGNLLSDDWRSPHCQSGTVLGLPQCYPGGTGRGLISCDVCEIYWNGEGKDCGNGFGSGNGWNACQGSGWICTWCLVGYVLTWSLSGVICLHVWVIWLCYHGRGTWVFGCIYTGQYSGSNCCSYNTPCSELCICLGWK